MAPLAGDISAAPTVLAFAAPVPPAPSPDDVAARAPSPMERVRESKQRAAVFATEVADWRGHDERPPRGGAPWPAFDESAVEEPYVPFDAGAGFDPREPLELRNPIRTRRSRRPLVIAVVIALAVALGALGAQRFVAGRLGHSTMTESAALSPPVGTSSTRSLQVALSPSLPLPAPTPAPTSAPAPSAAMLSSPPPAAPTPSTNDNGALLPSSLVTP
ncbi:MAG: hypothetical protein ACREEN_05060, partial [Stellaceae bacterium]